MGEKQTPDKYRDNDHEVRFLLSELSKVMSLYGLARELGFTKQSTSIRRLIKGQRKRIKVHAYDKLKALAKKEGIE